MRNQTSPIYVWAVGAAIVVTSMMASPARAADLAWGQWFVDLLERLEVSEQLRDPWVWFGFGAQGLFLMRFIWQWVVSEKRGRSTVPVAFWYFSLAGGLSLFVYATHNSDLVIMWGQLLACVIYVRNLMLIHRSAARRRAVGLRKVKLRSEVNGQNDDPQAP